MEKHEISSVLYTTEAAESRRQTEADLKKPDPPKGTLEKLIAENKKEDK